MRSLMMAVLVFVIGAPIALAQPPGNQGRGPAKMSYVQELNLTKDQIKAVRELQKETRKKLAEIKAKIEIKRIDFDEEIQKDKQDLKLVDKLIGDLAELHAQQSRVTLEIRARMMGLLTPEQKQKMVERMGMGMMGGSHMRGGAPDEPGEEPGGPGPR
ncbi:MAG: periplasmic heavy metal sensor [Nitrospinae bacterium]|nr:periplasmic heavy metal sensor [Nitrospinota bacterium]